MVKTRFIGCFAAKGGVGKTTSSINLAAALDYFGKSAIVVDANLGTPNVGLYLGIPIPPVTLHDVLANKHDITEAVYNHQNGMKMVPASIALKDAKKVDVNKIKGAVSELYGQSDFVIVDSPAGLGKEALGAIKAVDEALIITNPEMPAVTDALKTIKVCRELGKTVLGVIVTKTNSKNADMPLSDIERILEVPIIGIIPEDRAIKFSQVRKEPVIHVYPKSAAAVQYKKLAAELSAVPYNERIEMQEKGFIYGILRYLGFKD
jgi:septum site-determining protein MinD